MIADTRPVSFAWRASGFAALAGAFYLGRYVERRSTPAAGFGAEMTDLGPTGSGRLDDADVEGGHFDTIDGEQKEAESQRETVPPPAPRESPPATATVTKTAPESESKAAAASTGGSFYVQVLASRQRSSAESLIQKLSDAGFPARIRTEGGVHRVQVGGYASRDEVDAVRDRLREAGYGDAWVTESR
jgi:cell division septation protein DedD